MQLLAGCASNEPAPPPITSVPGVRVGPLIELLDTRTSRDKVKAVVDGDGLAHVLIAAKELAQVVEVVVRQDSVVERRVIRTGSTPSSLDAAFDERGRLHALLDAEHWEFVDGAWRINGRTPWQAAGVKAESPRWVPGAPSLTWSFQVDGAELGAPSRVDWYGIGNGMGAVIWPWFSHGTRAVLVAETPTGYGPWVVYEPEGKADTRALGFAADRRGKVHVVYGRSRPGIFSDPQPTLEYMTVTAKTLESGAAKSSEVGTSQQPRPRIVPIWGGHGWLTGSPGRSEFAHRVSVDPQTGTALVGTRWIVRNLVWTHLADWSYAATYAEMRPAGDDAFHCLFVGEPRDPWWGKGFPVRYAFLSEGSWSAPLDLGVIEEAPFLGYFWDGLAIGAAAGDAAYVVWPMERGIVGRRIERLH